MRACVRACVRAFVRACVRACVRVEPRLSEDCLRPTSSERLFSWPDRKKCKLQTNTIASLDLDCQQKVGILACHWSYIVCSSQSATGIPTHRFTVSVLFGLTSKDDILWIVNKSIGHKHNEFAVHAYGALFPNKLVHNQTGGIHQY